MNEDLYIRARSILEECEARWNNGDGKRVNDLIEVTRELLAWAEEYKSEHDYCHYGAEDI